jgi:hypothetical protein
MTQHDFTKWTMDDIYDQHIHVHYLTICLIFATKSCFCNYFYNYQISTHYLPHVLN